MSTQKTEFILVLFIFITNLLFAHPGIFKDETHSSLSSFKCRIDVG